VPSSIPDDCSQAVEGQIASFLSTVPDGSTVLFQPDGCYGEDLTIFVTDRENLIIDGNGSTFKALTKGSPGRSNWEVQAGNNITFENMTLDGANPKAGVGAGCYIAPLEWQHGIDFEATQGATVDQVSIYNVYGDFIEAQYDSRVAMSASQPARNILVENSYFSGNGRMGLGLTDVIGFTMRDSYMTGVCWDAVDIETDENSEYALDIKILDNTFGATNLAILANYGHGFEPNVGDITISGNTETGPLYTCESPIAVGQYPGENRSNYTITNNTLLAGGNGMDIEGVDNATIKNNTVTYTNEGCVPPAGVLLVDSHTVLIEGNALNGFPGGITNVDDLSTGVTVIGNSH
jgi:hypothetical protein